VKREEKIVELLNKQIEKIDSLKRLKRFSPEFKAWHRKTSSLLAQYFGEGSRQLKDFENVRYSLSVSMGLETEAELQRYYVDGLKEAKAVLNSIKEEIIEFQGLQPEDFEAIEFLTRIFNRFHLVARQLRNRHENRSTLDISDEYDVQDLLHALLRLFFDDIRPEEWTPSYAGGSARMDFLLKNEKIVVEVKKTRDNLVEKQIGEQLIQDIARYKAHPDCDHLVCFIYDPEEKIGNPRGLEADLSREEEDIKVSVYIRP